MPIRPRLGRTLQPSMLPAGLKNPERSMLPSMPVVVSSQPAQLDDELLGRASQSGCAAFAAPPAAACEAAAELAGGGNHEVRESVVRQRRHEFAPFGAG